MIGFTPCVVALMVKSRGGEKIAVVGHGHSRHAPPRGFGRQFADFAGAVEKRVIRVQMQMNEVRWSHSKPILNQPQPIGNRQSVTANEHSHRT